MPMLFLSPSTQEYNIYYDQSGSEEYYMNLIADRMEPYLVSSGITFERNAPSGSVGASVRKSNAGNFDLHLALHSNASGSANSGMQYGSDTYYYADSAKGKRAADIIVMNLKDIYPFPDRVRALPTTTLYELRYTKAPAVLAEIAYHDNPTDAEWIKSNLELIARTLVVAVCEYFGVPFNDAYASRTGTVTTGGGRLNLREKPSTDSRILTQIPNGTVITILGRSDGWYTAQYDGLTGYVFGQYITMVSE